MHRNHRASPMPRSAAWPGALFAAAAVLLVGGPRMAAGAGAPLGHPDFYPSHERPIGWRGDGTGAFPGATPVTRWDSKTGNNIAWKCRMPTPSWGQPIVVGEKVFTTADPNLLICVNVHTGKILWQRAVDHTTKMTPSEAKKARAEEAYFDRLFPVYVDGCRTLWKMEKLAAAKGFNSKELRTAVMKMGAVDSIYDHTKNYKNADVAKALANAEIKALFDSLIKLRKEFAFTFADPRRGENWSAIDGDSRNTTAGKPLNERADALIRQYDIWPWTRQNWYGCCTMTFAAPCSDGQYVYVAFPNNQVAAYDLSGNCKWMVWDHPGKDEGQGGVIHTRFVPSPLLSGNVLVVNQNGEVRAYDKKNGRKIWRNLDPYNRSRGGRSGRPHPEACSPTLVHVPYQGKTLACVSDAGGNLYRVRDGKIVCRTMPPSLKGQSPIGLGDLYIWKSGGDGRPYPIGVCRLKAASANKVECVELWKDNGARSGEYTAMVHDGAVYNAGSAWDLLTGKKLPASKLRSGWNSPILAGDYIVGAGGRSVGPWKKAGQVTQNVFEDDINALDPEWERKVYCGMSGTFGNSSWYAAGNRLFFRTAGHLWCIGDKSKRFRAPADMPAAARAGN
ncbi:PQQ-binding-like beta-propeller repeat protein [Verrucomicrobiota bacterium]